MENSGQLLSYDFIDDETTWRSGGFSRRRAVHRGDTIAAWVKQTYTPTVVDGVTVYDLTTR
jgi:hypothetical protein